MSLESVFAEAMPWVIKLAPALVALFRADGEEAKAIAGAKLLLAAERHRVDVALAHKHADGHGGDHG